MRTVLVFAAVLLNIWLVWVIKPYRLLNRCGSLGVLCCLYLQDQAGFLDPEDEDTKIIRNLGNNLHLDKA